MTCLVLGTFSLWFNSLLVVTIRGLFQMFDCCLETMFFDLLLLEVPFMLVNSKIQPASDSAKCHSHL